MNLEELKRRYEQRDVNYMAEADFIEAVTIQFPAIVAKLEAAQRLRDAMVQLLEDGVHPTWSGIKNAETALAAFDKERQ